MRVKPTVVRLPESFAARIDALAGGSKRRAKFIREAVEKELKRQEKSKRQKR